jgi:Eco57I restriction-modification methylase
MPAIYIRDTTQLPKRRANDYYRTEQTLIDTLLEKMPVPYLRKGKSCRRILDPAAADGRWGESFKRAWSDECDLVGIEIDPAWDTVPQMYDMWVSGDFASVEISNKAKQFGKFDVIVTNPPYGPQVKGTAKVEKIFSSHGWKYEGQSSLTLSEIYIRVGLDLLAPNGCMIYLLQLQMLAGADRGLNLWQTHAPELVWVCSRRPSFYDGKTNGTDFGLFFWCKYSDGTLRGGKGQWTMETFMYERDKEI